MSKLVERKIKGFGYKPDLGDIRDFKYSVVHKDEVSATIPSQASLLDKLGVVYDQLQLGSCVANACAGVLNFLHPNENPSRLEIYYNARKIENSIKTDAGCQIRDAIKGLATVGVGPETDYPYNIKNFTKEPKKVVTDSAAHKIITYSRITTLAEVKASIAAGFPVVIGISVYSQFESDAAAATGTITMPTKTDTLLGGHGIYLFGYDDKPATVDFRNSWNKTWGNNGAGTLPYAYIENSDLCTDMWAIRVQAA